MYCTCADRLTSVQLQLLVEEQHLARLLYRSFNQDVIRVINFELVQLICSAYINVTDGQTDGRLTIVIPR